MRAAVSELSKVMDTDEMTMFEGIWGEMHIEYDIFKTTIEAKQL